MIKNQKIKDIVLERVEESNVPISSTKINMYVDFLHEKFLEKRPYANPNELSNTINVSQQEAIQLFLVVTEDNLLFTPELALFCPTCRKEQIIEGSTNKENKVICNQCKGAIVLDTFMQENSYVLFKLNHYIFVDMDKFKYIGVSEGVCNNRPIVIWTILKPRYVVNYGSKEEIINDLGLNIGQIEECYIYHTLYG